MFYLSKSTRDFPTKNSNYFGPQYEMKYRITFGMACYK